MVITSHNLPRKVSEIVIYNSMRIVYRIYYSWFCNHVVRQPFWASIQQNFFLTKDLHETGVQFPEERNVFILDHQHGRRDVTCDQQYGVLTCRIRLRIAQYTGLITNMLYLLFYTMQICECIKRLQSPLHQVEVLIDHFRAAPSVWFNVRLSANPLI